MKKTISILLLCLLTISLCADNSPIKKRHGRDRAVKKIMSSMTLRQMVGQMFMADSYALYDTAGINKIIYQIENNYIGGICFFKGNCNDLIRMNEIYKQKSKIPLFVAIDGEWGLTMRMTDGITFPMAMTSGALTKDNSFFLYLMGNNIAEQCKAMGININFAPVGDININPLNPVINMRSFGEDKQKVSEFAVQYIKGMQDKGVMGVIKHFPGHGDTKTDSHKATVSITHSKDFIDTIDSYPFRKAVENNVWGIMAGHLQVGALSKDSLLPATVNKDIIDGYLHGDLNFKGLVFTDAMNMKGITSLYPQGEAEVMAVLSGIDIILMPENIDSSINAVIHAVEQGRISENFIKEKCRKILSFKYDMGLMKEHGAYKMYDSDITSQSEKIIREIYGNALTSVNNKGGKITDNTDTVVVFSIGKTDYKTLLTGIAPETKIIYNKISTPLNKTQSDSLFKSLPKNKKTYTLIAGGKFAKASSYYGVDKNVFSVLNSICKNTSDNTLIAFCNPYILQYIEGNYNFKDIIVAYENNDYTQQSVAKAINGEIVLNGELPVVCHRQNIPLLQDTVKSNGFDKHLTDSLKMDYQCFVKIDSIINNGLSEKAYPGCQVLIAKDNKIVFDKSYGYLSYDSLIKTSDETIYDLASVTKVLATTLAVMKLYEQGKVNLDSQIKKYVPEYKHSKIGKLTVKELLSHYTTLPATYPFWQKTFKDSLPDSSLYAYNVFMDENYMPVTDSLFILKSHKKIIKKQLKDVKLHDKKYVYSDLNFLLLQYMVENLSGQTLDDFLNKEFYEPMQLKICFNPLDKGFDYRDIAPTENDTVFRRQLVCGSVHDPLAALNGGVCGNAGLFSNARDVYSICQMLLNNGVYNGVRYLDSLTVKTFNTRYFEDKTIRRALGFDKPFIVSQSTHCSKYASQESYGHSGFTGTYIWIDPQNQTVFIFLSNRVNPYSTPNKLATMNIRTDIHDLIYQSLNSGK